jgi:hypothetical protein
MTTFTERNINVIGYKTNAENTALLTGCTPYTCGTRRLFSGVLHRTLLKCRAGFCSLLLSECVDLFYTPCLSNFLTNISHLVSIRGTPGQSPHLTRGHVSSLALFSNGTVTSADDGENWATIIAFLAGRQTSQPCTRLTTYLQSGTLLTKKHMPLVPLYFKLCFNRFLQLLFTLRPFRR